MKQRSRVPDMGLSATDATTLIELQAGGWRAEYSPVTSCWRLVHDANRWTTSLFRLAADAVSAAMKLQTGAEQELARRQEHVESLRRAFRAVGQRTGERNNGQG